MPFSFLQQKGNLADYARELTLSTYVPSIALDGLARGVDNVRHDVYLSPKFTEIARQQLFRLVAKYGNVEDIAAEEADPARPPSMFRKPGDSQKLAAYKPGVDPAEFRRMLVEVHVSALNRAKSESNISIDLMARLAVIKFLRNEMPLQFNQVIERCRAKLKHMEGPRQSHANKAHTMRERFSQFQIAKKAVLRKVGQDLFETLREIEKQTLSKMRRSLFGEEAAASYDLFLNRLLFTEDGRDDYLNAEHYVMLGNYERDSDRFQTMFDIASAFLRALNIDSDGEQLTVDSYLCAPENAQELIAGGSPEEVTPRGKAQKAILTAWVGTLERENVMEHVIASYEAVPLLGEYSPPINAQQLKNALISKTERKRVETLLQERGGISLHNLNAAVKRVDNTKDAERAKIAGRFLGDFMRYTRDLRRLEALTTHMDSINVISNEKLRQLSTINNTLYEFLLQEEQKPAEEKITHHVILKADIRDSTMLTRSLFERGLNPASYFSLNFYEPINKLLPKYGASKVFIEGDAVILALFEREGEPGFGVARACVLAREMIEIVRAYNEKSTKSGLPTLELGIGIAYQDAAPMFLMDGASRIMISAALNLSDRLSSCSKNARKHLDGVDSLFNVYSFQTLDYQESGQLPEEFMMRYNMGGINIDQAAFEKLNQEISLQLTDRRLPTVWDSEQVRLYSGLVPVAAGSFHRIVLREGKIPQIDPHDFAFKAWTTRSYYEVCSNPDVYELIEAATQRAATTSSGD
jgi:class 3 adenylate cyclase